MTVFAVHTLNENEVTKYAADAKSNEPLGERQIGKA